MPKPTRDSLSSSSEQRKKDELSELMALLGEAGDDSDEPVDDRDLAVLLDEIGASSKEREEHEVRELLEGMPELSDEGGHEEELPDVSSEALGAIFDRSSGDEAPGEDDSAELLMDRLGDEDLSGADHASDDQEPLSEEAPPTREDLGSSELTDADDAGEAEVGPHEDVGRLGLDEALGGDAEGVSSEESGEVPIDAARESPSTEADNTVSGEGGDVHSDESAVAGISPPILSVDSDFIPPSRTSREEPSKADSDVTETTSEKEEASRKKSDSGMEDSEHQEGRDDESTEPTATSQEDYGRGSMSQLPEIVKQSLDVGDAASAEAMGEGEDETSSGAVTLKEIFGPGSEIKKLGPEAALQPEAPSHSGSDSLEDDTPNIAIPPLRDPLAARRARANRLVEEFLRDDVKTPLNFRILRFMLLGGLDQLSVEEIQEEMVESPETLNLALEQLERSGLIICARRRFSINPRARKLTLLGTAIAQWQVRRRRDQIWATFAAIAEEAGSSD